MKEDYDECEKCGDIVPHSEGEYISNSFYCDKCLADSDDKQDAKNNSSCYSVTY